MKFYYPRFLKTNPSFIGLSIFDLFIMVGALIVSVIFNFGSVGSLVMIAVSIGCFKIVTLKFPPHYFSLFFTKTETLKWKAKVRSLMNGVLV
ncbi:MAG: hypothetical protein Q7U04_06925 [Bacteriovorax sp.]|nr:hypothetical protein [Bacteriovorax sp.]